MEHGHYIGKIGLVVTNEQHIVIGQAPYNVGTLYLQFVETLVTLMCDHRQDTDQPFFEKQAMPERIFAK
jgi:hypothetical protein